MTSTIKKPLNLYSNGKHLQLYIQRLFGDYQLPPLPKIFDKDPCNPNNDENVNVNVPRFTKYQEFIGEVMTRPEMGGVTSGMLLYWGLSAGKTAAAYNLINKILSADPNSVIIILIKAILKDDPWLKDAKKFFDKDVDENDIPVERSRRFKRLYFINYDSPFADDIFTGTIKKLDRANLHFVIDEVHNFVRNVRSNMTKINLNDYEKIGKALFIFNFIRTYKSKYMNTCKVLVMSATPVINDPFELSIIFNMLRPGKLPLNETEFNDIFVQQSAFSPIINKDNKNVFMRSILGCVSYYAGASPDLFASFAKSTSILVMSPYQYEVFHEFDKKEIAFEEFAAKRRRYTK